jgi:hypothetical protein
MIATLPAVQGGCRGVRRYACIGDDTMRDYKRTANRRHRRALNRATRRMIQDPERWWDEGFNAPSLSDWDLW